MSYANGTQFYNLPQTVGTDKRDWFDTNAAFAAIDAALHSAVTGQATDAEAIAIINSKLATDEADIAALQTASSSQAASISALQTAVNGQAIQIADVRQDAEDMISAYNEGAAETSTHAYAIGDYFIYNDVLYKATAAIAIGDTIVPNTNCQATNVTTQIKALESVTNKVGDLTTLTTTDKSSVVAGINEVNANVGTLSSLTTTDKTSAVAAINEVKSYLYAGSISVVADGIKTYNQLLTDLRSQINYSKIRKESNMVITDTSGLKTHLYSAHYNNTNDAILDFGGCVAGSVHDLRIYSGDTHYILVTLLGDPVTPTHVDKGATVPSNGFKIELFY